MSQFVERYRHGAAWEYDHPLERRALERGYGIIVWQEQVVQLIMDVAGMTAAQADEVRRAFAKPGNEHLIALHWRRFLEGAQGNGVSEETARQIFAKINGHYMFPESHSHAFAVTAYQAAWLKRHYPLEFFVSLMNNQPMGFYPLETLKQDARRFGVPFRNPCVNRSRTACVPEDGAVRLGLQLIKDVGAEAARRMVEEREERGPYAGAGDLVRRTGLKPQAVLSLVRAGAFDALTPNRRAALWDAGLSIRPSRNGQRAFPVSTQDGAPDLADFTAYERMVGEYRVMAVYPRGHLMEFVRPTLSPKVLPTAAVEAADEGEEVLVAGWPVAGSTPGARTARSSSPSRTRRATCSSSSGPTSSPATAGSSGAGCSWSAASSPDGTAPPTSSSPTCGPSMPMSRCPPPTTGTERRHDTGRWTSAAVAAPQHEWNA